LKNASSFSIFSSFIITSDIFLKGHHLCPFYGEMCKKSESVTIYGSQEVVKNLSFLSNS
jgi:hypothetical protein